MGTVNIHIADNCCLEYFVQQWETHFFNSYFSHLVGGHMPVKTNIVQLWQGLVNSGKQFPTEVLLKTGKTIQHLIS